MITFIYSVQQSSRARGHNQTITVWRLKRNKPVFVGSNDQINTASTKGCKGEAVQVIERELNIKSVNGRGYDLDNSKYQLFEV